MYRTVGYDFALSEHPLGPGIEVQYRSMAVELIAKFQHNGRGPDGASGHCGDHVSSGFFWKMHTNHLKTHLDFFASPDA